jgi:hypothetical protein
MENHMDSSAFETAERIRHEAEQTRQTQEARRQADEAVRVRAEAERTTAERDRVAAGQNVTETVATLGILIERMENVENMRRTLRGAHDDLTN